MIGLKMINRYSVRQFASSIVTYLAVKYNGCAFAENYRYMIKSIVRIAQQHENEMIVTFQQFDYKTKIVFYDLSDNVLSGLLVQKKDDLMFVSVIKRGC